MYPSSLIQGSRSGNMLYDLNQVIEAGARSRIPGLLAAAELRGG